MAASTALACAAGFALREGLLARDVRQLVVVAGVRESRDSRGDVGGGAAGVEVPNRRFAGRQLGMAARKPRWRNERGRGVRRRWGR